MKVIVAGNGIAGITVARLVREKNPDARIRIYSQEKLHYYPRPQLTEVMGAERLDAKDLILYQPSWYEDRRIEVSLGVSVERIDREASSVVLSDGSRAEYNVLVLAVGARGNRPPISGLDKQGCFTLRTFEDLLSIRQFASNARRGVVIGGGLLGLEAAKGLRSLGLDVSVVEFFPRLLPRQLDVEGADLFRARLEAMGIRVFVNAATSAISGKARVDGIVLKDGTTLPCDLILVSAGITPNKELAEGAGLATGKGVIVDSTMRTSDPDIFAVGDCAEHEGRIYGIIPAATDQARVAADNITGNATVYRGTIPSNTLKAVGIDLTSIGVVTPEADGFEEFRVRDDANGLYKKVALRDGKVVGAIVIGETRSVPYLAQLINRGIDVSLVKDRLLDAGFDLKAFVREASSKG